MQEKRIFHSIIFFLSVGAFSYVFSGLAGLNLPKYYPELRVWSIKTLEGQSMGFYGKVAFVFIFSIILAKMFYLLYPLLEKHLNASRNYLIGFASSTLITGILFFVVEEWHSWGIAKRKLDNGLFSNVELWLFLVVAALFIILYFIFQAIDGKYRSSSSSEDKEGEENQGG